MSRIRTIKPQFFSNEGLSDVPEAAQILAGGLLCYADDEGYFNAHPGLIKANVFPLRKSITEESVIGLCEELSKIEYVRFGTGKDGKRYGQVVNFAEHQKISHLTPSKIKKMEIIWDDSGKFPESSVKPPDILRPEGNKEGKGIRKGIEKHSASPAARGSEFSRSVAQTRHSRITEMIKTAYRENNRIDCPWDGSEAKQLQGLLKATPNWGDQQIAQCLVNFFLSDFVPPGTRPREWIQKLPKYLQRPLTKEAGHGNKGDERDRRILERTRAAEAEFGGFSGGDPETLSH